LLALTTDNRNSGAMAERDEAVLVSGLYGSGKSSLVAEMAEMLEAADLSFGAIDVDWLSWYHRSGVRDENADLRTQNLASVITTYLGSGVQHLLLADAVRDDEGLAQLRTLIPCPLHVVLLETPMDVIEHRLGNDPMSGRARDLRNAHKWTQTGMGRITADLVLDGRAPLPQSAQRVLTWLGWLPDVDA
jgi:hypothetical protein